MSANKREGIGVDGEGICDEVVEIGSDGDFVGCVGHDLRQNRVPEARFGIFHGLFQKCVTFVAIILKAALINPWVKIGCVLKIETFDAEVFSGGPLLQSES